MLHEVSPLVALVVTVLVTGVSLASAHYVDKKRRFPLRAGETMNRGLGFGWCSPEALMSLRISPMHRTTKSPSPPPRLQ